MSSEILTHWAIQFEDQRDDVVGPNGADGAIKCVKGLTPAEREENRALLLRLRSAVEQYSKKTNVAPTVKERLAELQQLIPPQSTAERATLAVRQASGHAVTGMEQATDTMKKIAANPGAALKQETSEAVADFVKQGPRGLAEKHPIKTAIFLALGGSLAIGAAKKILGLEKSTWKGRVARFTGIALLASLWLKFSGKMGFGGPGGYGLSGSGEASATSSSSERREGEKKPVASPEKPKVPVVVLALGPETTPPRKAPSGLWFDVDGKQYDAESLVAQLKKKRDENPDQTIEVNFTFQQHSPAPDVLGIRLLSRALNEEKIPLVWVQDNTTYQTYDEWLKERRSRSKEDGQR